MNEPELEELLGVDEQLRGSRPHANPAFRSELGSRLERTVERLDPDRDRALIVVYGGCGAVLLLAGALSAVGIGPLG